MWTVIKKTENDEEKILPIHNLKRKKWKKEK
jgi:hypothetical protein